MNNQSIGPGSVVCLNSNPDCKMTVGHRYADGFFDCVWVAANKELQVRKFHQSMLSLQFNQVQPSENKPIGFQVTPVPAIQPEFYTPIKLRWL